MISFDLPESVDQLRGKGRGWILVVIASSWLVVFGVRFVIPVLLPAIKAEFTVSNTVAGLAITLIWGCYALVQFPAGLLTDWGGERTILLVSMGIGAGSIALLASAPLLPVFLVGCAVFGLGTGMFAPPRVTALSNTFPNADRFAYGLTFAAGNLGTAVLPALAGFVTTRISWRAGLWITFPLFVFSLVGVWLFIPRGTPDVSKTTNTFSQRSVRRIANSVRSYDVLVAGGGITLVLFIYQGFTTFLPTYLIVVKNLEPQTAALLFGWYFLIGAVFQPISGYAADRYEDSSVMMVYAGLTAVSLFALPFVNGLVPLTLLIFVSGVRAGIPPVNNAYIVSALPDDIQGSGYGLIRTAYMLVGSTGSVVIGLFGDANMFDEAFLLLGGLSTVAVIVYFHLPSQ